MIYERDKIRRLIEYKDKINNEQMKNDLQWILGQYNNYYIRNRDFRNNKITYNKMIREYYNLEDERSKIKEELILTKRKYKVLEKLYNELLSNYKACCKKLKSVI